MRLLLSLTISIGLCLGAPSEPRAAGPAPAQVSELRAPASYDPAPFAQTLRPYYAKSTRKRMGIAALTDLPLYQMELELDALQGELSGRQELNFFNAEPKPLEALVFRTLANARQMQIDHKPNLRVGQVSVNGLPVLAEKLSDTCLEVKLPEPLEPGQRVLVGIEYDLHIPRLPASAAGPMAAVSPDEMMKQMFGNQASAGYGILGQAAGIVNLGYFYPILASRGPEGWDTSEPAAMGDMADFAVANYQVKVVAPQSMVLASSGVQVGSNALGSGAQAGKETFLLGAALRHFALQASTRYEIAERDLKDIKLRYYHVEEHAASAKPVLAQAAKALEAYQRLLGPYPYTEIDVVEAPLTGGAGGVEYPGLVTVALALAAGPSGNANTDMLSTLMAQTQTTEFVLAHELAHQWFHVLVGSDSNEHPFQDEALANYATVLYFEAAHGKAKAAEQIDLQLKMPYQLMRTLGGPDGAVDRPTRAFANQLQYSALVYGKGALYFHALRGAIGHKRLFAGLKDYVGRFAFRQATPADLQASLKRGSGKPAKVASLWKRWLEESHGDQDIGRFDMNKAMRQLMDKAGQLQGFHNMKVQGLDPATLKMFQQALKQLQGN